MSMYLPIAEMATNPFVIIFFGALVGAMSGLFGVGGGFLMVEGRPFCGAHAQEAQKRAKAR